MIQTHIGPDLLEKLVERASAETHVVLVMNTPNKNSRIYPTDVVADAISKFTLPSFGCFIEDFARTGYVPLEKISHKTIDLWIDGDNLMAKIVVLKNLPNGKYIDLLGADFRTCGTCMLNLTPGQPNVATITDFSLLAITACAKGSGS